MAAFDQFNDQLVLPPTTLFVASDAVDYPTQIYPADGSPALSLVNGSDCRPWVSLLISGTFTKWVRILEL
jgi:hypothetical protein